MDGEGDFNDWGLGSEENSIYHFFKMHDYDKNNKLDGLEVGNTMLCIYSWNRSCLVCRAFPVYSCQFFPSHSRA